VCIVILILNIVYLLGQLVFCIFVSICILCEFLMHFNVNFVYDFILNNACRFFTLFIFHSLYNNVDLASY